MSELSTANVTSASKTYAACLDELSLARYKLKLSFIKGIDPYGVREEEFSTDNQGLPNITYPDIVNYLVNTAGSYILKEMKAYKSLESYKYFVCGWVKDVQHRSINDQVIIIAKMRNSQSSNGLPLRPWIIAQKDGEILTAHCTCKTGLDKTCSHIEALLYAVEAAVQIRDSKTMTEEAAYWLLPTAVSNVKYSEVRNIDFRSRQTMKRKMNVARTGSPSVSPESTQKLPSVLPPTDEESDAFLAKLKETKDNPVLLSVMPRYSVEYAPTSLNQSYPQILTDLYEEKCALMPRHELVKHCGAIFETIRVTEEQSINVQITTRAQASIREWVRFRSGRITASKVKAVCSTSIENPPQSLLYSICYPQNKKLSNQATRRGCDHEELAVQRYSLLMEENHANFKCEKSGLVLNYKLPYMSAYPDALVSCDCCGLGLLEVKCPFCKGAENLSESGTSCLEHVDGRLRLRRSHTYYYRVQTQLLVCEREFVDFVLWTDVDTHFERIQPDEGTQMMISGKSKEFFKHVILPELVGKLYSRPQPSAVDNVVFMQDTPENMLDIAEVTCIG
ncbi:uncharacterized protein LOC133497991 [Syngnathoides biaculeatus]|uniref:uncharacterized protein LOC133497991 n=1 Tax=Syngnathoides biaculeatus TaxID=300417 RepID=UPI002ADE15B6|nr:uncharacterized protein LOC133497991 [Syngnathoides biaculeatus]